MEAEKYLSVKKFAETANVSTQAVYSRLQKDLKPYLKFEGKIRKLSTKALSLFTPTKQPNDNRQETENVIFKLIKSENELETTNRKKPVFEVMLLSLKNQLEIKDMQLQEKDKQIESLSQALINAQINANQAQSLHAETIKQLPEENTTPKKGFFSKLFSRKH